MKNYLDQLHRLIDLHQHAVNFRVIKDRSSPLEDLDDTKFVERYRFSKAGVVEIMDMIQLNIHQRCDQTIHIPPILQLLITLRWYASGSFQLNVGDIMGIHQCTVSRTVKNISMAIASHRSDYITFPTENEITDIQRGFYDLANFPVVIGTIDCTHMPIQCPKGEQAELFRNRKGWHSINVQVKGDHNLIIRDIVARWPGATHDTRIFDNSAISLKLEERQSGYILGNAGYPCRAYLLTPFPNPASNSERKYNISHATTRNTIERLFGVLKRRFPCLSRKIRTNLDTTMAVIVATAILHNVARRIKMDEITDEVPHHDQPDSTECQGITKQGNRVRRNITDSYFK